MELIGRRFGHIRVTEVVGQGGMGDVYAGYDEKLERKVALKVLNSDQRLDDEARERLLREARALSKLEHPNICRIHDYIETGDVDLLVLEYIDGKTLHEAMMERLPRAEKVRIAIAIAEVLVQAHRAGIVHRDLKPENVMLTKSGEVKVLDFGLARWLNRARGRSSDRHAAVSKLSVRTAASPVAAPDHAAETLSLPYLGSSGGSMNGRRAFLATAVGITLGTPLYMSPEQARGESLTPASDMFSFGLLLQVLFTGQEPHPDDLSAREVILRVARGTTEPVHGAPRDITALINRLKQFAPADRPTAVEVVERLQFLDEKPQRIARRAIAAAVAFFALLGAWRYTVDLKAERAIAEAARADAEHRRAQAEDLINFMVGDLRTKLEPVGRLEVLDGVAEKALQYVGSSKRENLSAVELIAHSKALNQLGDVRMGQGKPIDDALPLFRESLARAEAAVRREPANDEAKFAVALSRFWLANGHRVKADIPAATAHAKVYLAVTSDLARRHPKNETYQLEASYAHSMMGLLLEAQRDLKGAIAEYQKTLAIKEAYAARHPNDDKAKEDVARTINKIGFALWKSGDLHAARRQFQNEVLLREQLRARHPREMRWKQDLAVSHSFLSGVLEDVGDLGPALQHRREDLRLNAELVAHDPTNTTWRRNLAIAHLRLGSQLSARGETDEALQHIRTAEAEMQSLVKADATRALWRIDLTNIQMGHVRVLLDRRDTEAARAKAEAVLTTLERSPDAAARSLGYAHLLLGTIAREQHRTEESQRHLVKAAELLKPVSTSDPTELQRWVRALIGLDRREEATAAVARLRAVGYKNPEFESLTRSEGY